jgi:glycosyltransferase involved in cell wall biosynthesis
MSARSYVVITPVRNEAQRLSKTIASMIAQTHRPTAWVIVDDGSGDETPAIVDEAARTYSWIRAVHRPDRGVRKSGAGVVEAFYDGYRFVAAKPWDFLVKLDADLWFAPTYFGSCLDRFASDSSLGIGGGTVCIEDGDEIRIEVTGDPAFHVRGATKIYRRRCWIDIGELVRAPGWDTVDEVKANMKGWSTRTFSDLHVVQLKRTGSADGAWRNWFKNGRGCYICGYDPVFMLAKCLKRSVARPPVIPAVALGIGFCSGYIRRLPRIGDPDLIRYLRRQQRHRLLGRQSIYT